MLSVGNCIACIRMNNKCEAQDGLSRRVHRRIPVPILDPILWASIFHEEFLWALSRKKAKSISYSIFQKDCLERRRFHAPYRTYAVTLAIPGPNSTIKFLLVGSNDATMPSG
jgi:hypothetical protein